MKFSFNYDEKEDILYIHNEDIVKFSLNFHDMFIIDFNHNNKVVGIEVIDASEVIYDLKKSSLKTLEHASINAKYRDGVITVLLLLKSKEETTRTSVPIPVYTKK
mgnify:CR=1 FL=1